MVDVRQWSLTSSNNLENIGIATVDRRESAQTNMAKQLYRVYERQGKPFLENIEFKVLSNIEFVLSCTCKLQQYLVQLPIKTVRYVVITSNDHK